MFIQHSKVYKNEKKISHQKRFTKHFVTSKRAMPKTTTAAKNIYKKIKPYPYSEDNF